MAPRWVGKEEGICKKRNNGLPGSHGNVQQNRPRLHKTTPTTDYSRICHDAAKHIFYLVGKP